MSRRIITTENLEEDAKIENNLRPQLLDDYIGQEAFKKNLKVSPFLFTNCSSAVTLEALTETPLRRQ